MASKNSSHLVLALVVDAVLVVLFAVTGHYQHYGSFDPGALVNTAWPFLAGLAAAWLLIRVWDRPLSPLATGTGVWAITVLLGMIIRFLGTGAGVAESFLVVAAGLNFLTLVGWRVIASAVLGRRPAGARAKKASR